MESKLLNQLIVLFAAAFLIPASNAQQQDQDATGSKSTVSCPERLNEFQVGAATAEDVKRCNGEPQTQNSNPDGRFAYMYELRNGIVIAYLFGPDRLLLRTNVYQYNGGK
jgi:hypothetical protein